MNILLILFTALLAQANEQYNRGNYAEAAALYAQSIDADPEGQWADKEKAVLYYNLGNACFKQGELAQSILAYERSLRLDPSNKDARYNLQFAESRITDNITDNRAFFLTSFLRAVRDRISEQTWLWMSVIAFWILLVGALCFALLKEPWQRKTAFSFAVVGLVVAIAAFCNTASLHKRDTLRSEAVITQGIVNAKASPDRSGTELFTLHEGTKVHITETLGEWCNISVGNYQGWIQLQNVERI